MLEAKLLSVVSVGATEHEHVHGDLSKFPILPCSNPPGKEHFSVRPDPSPAFSSKYTKLTKVYKRVVSHGVPNYRGARVPLDHKINIKEWRGVSHLISDKALPDMLAYGFPAGHAGPIPTQGLTNHSSACKNPTQIDKFIHKESSLGALAGPFTSQPFIGWFRQNPMMTRPKRDSSELRVILDLSFPVGSGVNAGIDKCHLDEANFKLRLPSPLDLARTMKSLGRGCKLYKIDLSRTYRQLRSDPLDWPLLGIGWDDQYFVDLAIPFGLRHGASACQRVSEAAGEVAAAEHGTLMHAYVDDTGGAALEEVADAHYKGLLATFERLGLDVAPLKCQAPSYVMIWIGVLFNTLTMSMAIDPERIQEAVNMCNDFLAASTITLAKLQSFLGKLFHAVKCTVSARVFLSRLLDLLREATNKQSVVISEKARADAWWCASFLHAFNGVTLAKPDAAEVVAFVDSCLVGAGGACRGYGYYSIAYPDSITSGGLSISSLECFSVLLPLRIWVRAWSGLHVLLYCDNAATVSALESGRAQDPLIRGSLREVWWLSAVWDVQLTVRHRPGAEMEEADLLSRADTSPAFKTRFETYVRENPDSHIHVETVHLSPPIPI